MDRFTKLRSGDPVALSRALGLLRVGIGVGLLAFPGLFPRVLAGAAPRDDVTAAARIAGARDLGMGLGALAAAQGGPSAELRRWAAASAVADALDAVAMARARSLRAVPRRLAMTAGLGAALVGVVAVRRLP